MPPLRIALPGPSSRSGNLGVGALTAAQVEILRGIGRALARPLQISILEWREPREPYVTGADLRHVAMTGRFLIEPGGLWRELRRADLVIDISGGDSFTDIYGPKRLRRIFWMKYATHLARRPLVMAPQTVGPFRHRRSRLLARLSLQRCALVATRDALSTAAVRAMGLRRPLIEASDVALRLPCDPPPPRDGGPPRVGLNVSGLLMEGGYSGRNEFGIALDYPALVRALVAFFQGEGAEVHLVPHVLVHPARPPREDDARACAALAAALPDTVLAPAFASPSAAKSYIAGMDFFLGARMHACIAAFSSGVPVIPMAYSRKFAGLFGSLGYERTVDCTRATAEAVLEAVRTGWHGREALAAEVRQSLARGNDRLERYVTQLRELIERLPRRRAG